MSNVSELRLRPPRSGDESAVRAAQDLVRPDNFEFALGLTPQFPWSAYLQQLALERAGMVPADRVPATFLVADVGAEIVGRVSIRHTLNPALLEYGGHIGYAVVPAFRRRGYATEILKQSLIIAHSLGVERALLTCDDSNAASIAVIERCGGKLDEQWPTVVRDIPGRRYWID